MTQCPQCGSQKLWKDGLRKLTDSTVVQRWLCRHCGYRFTDPNHKRRSRWKNLPFSLNPPNSLDNNCQGNNEPSRRDSTALAAVHTLAEVEKENEKRVAGATSRSLGTEIHGKIVEFLWWMKKHGYKETTIKGKWKRLSRLVKLGANLLDPESVKDVIALQGWKDSTKETTVHIYDSFVKWTGGLKAAGVSEIFNTFFRTETSTL